MKTLFVYPPAPGRSAYPMELARASALVTDSRLLDACADGLSVDETLHVAADYDLIVLQADCASLSSALSIAELFKLQSPAVTVGLIGAAVAAEAERILAASRDVDFIACEESPVVCAEIAGGCSFADVAGLCYRTRTGVVRRAPLRRPALPVDTIPWLAPVFRQHLTCRHYRTSFLRHPYVPVPLGAGSRTRSVQDILDEVRWVCEYMTDVREVFFCEGDFAHDAGRAAVLARGLKKLAIAWSCSVNANVPYETLRVMRANGVRLVLVNYDSGSNLILHASRNGRRTETAARFAIDCRRLGILVHGAFVFGLPGETHNTLQQTIDFAIRVNPHTIHISIADARGTREPLSSRPVLALTVLESAAAECYRRFYLRPAKFLEIATEMLSSWEMACRRLRDAMQFYRFLKMQAPAKARLGTHSYFDNRVG